MSNCPFEGSTALSPSASTTYLDDGADVATGEDRHREKVGVSEREVIEGPAGLLLVPEPTRALSGVSRSRPDPDKRWGLARRVNHSGGAVNHHCGTAFSLPVDSPSGVV